MPVTCEVVIQEVWRVRAALSEQHGHSLKTVRGNTPPRNSLRHSIGGTTDRPAKSPENESLQSASSTSNVGGIKAGPGKWCGTALVFPVWACLKNNKLSRDKLGAVYNISILSL